MAVVWLAEDVRLGRLVALKELGRSQAGESWAVRKKRTQSEAKARARLRHPGIVEIYDMFEEDDHPWIVMAHVKGHTLQDLIDEGFRPEERRLAAIGRDVLDALDAAHRADVLHRDIKPAN